MSGETESGSSLMPLILLSCLTAAPMLIGLFNRSQFLRTFSILAFLFAVVFYCLPLSLVLAEEGITYLGHRVVYSESSLNDAVIGMLVFSAGFAVYDLWSRAAVRRPPPVEGGNSESRPVVLFEALLALIFLVTLYIAYTSDFYQTSIEIRREQRDADYLIATILMMLYLIGLFFLIRAMGKGRVLVSLFWFVATLLLILTFGGRFQTLLVLALPVVHFVKKINLALLVLLLVFIGLFPIVVNGKEIIYLLFNDGDIIRAIARFYRMGVDINSLVANFAHPVVSYYYAPLLADSLGYRLFWDIPQGFLFYLKLVGIDFGDSLTYFNTEMIIFQRESTIPPGYLAFGYVQANLIGVFLMGAFFRGMGSVGLALRDHLSYKTKSADFFCAFMAANTFYIGEMRGLVMTFVVPCLLFYGLSVLDRRQSRRSVPSPLLAT